MAASHVPEPRSIEVMDECMVPILRAMTGAQRLRSADGMYHWARKVTMHRLRREHPEWPESRVVAVAAERLSHGVIRADTFGGGSDRAA
jgi:hypothetical protein